MRRTTAIKRCAALSAAMACLAPAMAPPAGSAVPQSTCVYDPATSTVHLSLDGTDNVLRTAGGRIEFGEHVLNVQPCGNATLRNTDSIVAVEQNAGTTAITLSQSAGGKFGPGRTPETDGGSEIEIDLGTVRSAGFIGKEIADRITVGSLGLSLNGDGDLDVRAPALEVVRVQGVGGNDILSAEGGFGAGDRWRSIVGAGMFAAGGDGDDRIIGSPGPDTITGNSGFDTLHGRGGDDHVTGEEGDDRVWGGAGHDVLDGGPDRDRLDGGYGNDELQAAGDSAPDQLMGGPDSDTCYVESDDTMLDTFETVYST